MEKIKVPEEKMRKKKLISMFLLMVFIVACQHSPDISQNKTNNNSFILFPTICDPETGLYVELPGPKYVLEGEPIPNEDVPDWCKKQFKNVSIKEKGKNIPGLIIDYSDINETANIIEVQNSSSDIIWAIGSDGEFYWHGELVDNVSEIVDHVYDFFMNSSEFCKQTDNNSEKG